MADKYGRTPYQIMLENGATEDELRQRLEGRGTAQSYLDREAQKAAAAAAARPTYAIPAQNFDGMARMGASGGWTIDDSNSATWQKIAQLANSGNTQAAIDLANQLSAAGQFGGYWDDDGNYWGFAQGYTGGANASMQPVIGGKILTPKGLEYENTNVWLTPDGKALNYGQGGVLTNNGETWGTTNNKKAQGAGRWYEENGYEPQSIVDVVGKNLDKYSWGDRPDGGYYSNPALNTLEGNQKRLAELQSNPNADPAAIAELRSYIQKQQGATTPYQQMLNNYPTGGSYNDLDINPQSPNYSEMILTAAPEAYDPNSSQAMQDWQKNYGIGTGPQWDGGTYNATDNTMYQDILKWADENKAPEYAGDPYQALRDEHTQNAANMEWNYDPNTDPVWQAYQKQYRREGQRATEDTLGRVAGMTGGMPSSYAVTAASQAGNYYASQLSDKLPQLYQDAYNRYLQEYQRQLGLADAYNQYGQTDYNRYRDSVDDYYTDLKTRYQMAMDNIGLEQGDWDRKYGIFQDELNRYNKDRDFYYGVGQDEISNGRQYWQDQNTIYQNALAQQNYENERMQYLREYADTQNWKAAEWQQYLREYGDQLSQQEREWVYKQMQAANDQALDLAKLGAQYGDYSGLSGLGIDTSTANPKEVAYASDGSTYKFNTQDALYFVQNAPNGTAGNPTTMKGSDGSIWRKDEYGNVTITTQNGKTFTYSNNTPAVTGSGKSSGTGRGSGSGGSGSGGSDNDAMSRMSAAGISSEGEAYNWLLANGYGVTAAGKLAKYYAESLGNNNGSSYSDDDVSRAWDIINGKYPNANQAAVTWAQQVLGETSGLDFGTGGNAGSVNDPTYANLEESLDRMAANNRSRDEIFAEIDGEVRDGRITKAQGDALKQKYYGGTDNVPNVGKHSDGRPQSSGFSSVLQQADTLYGSRGDLNGAIDAIRKAYESGLIHEYEIDIIMDRLGL